MSYIGLLNCPVDQLHLAGMLCEDLAGDRRYIAAKRLQRCSPDEFLRVCCEFASPEQGVLVFKIVRGSQVLPASSSKWLPQFREALDIAADFWGIPWGN